MQQHQKNNEESTLIARIKKGEYYAFRKLVEQYQGRIYSVCFGIVRNREDAFDAVQEVFIKIYKSIKKFNGTGGIYTWMYRVAVNTCLDFIRKRKRKQNLIEKSTQDKMAFPGREHPKTPEEEVISIELKDAINEAIEKLPKKHKTVIVLREVEGLSYQEIAKIMKCSHGTVMSRLYYARQKLMSLLRKYITVTGDANEPE